MLKELDWTPDSHDRWAGPGPPGPVPSRPLDRFVCRHRDMVYNVAYRILGDQELAARVTGDTLARSFPLSASFRGKVGHQILIQLVASICRDPQRHLPAQEAPLSGNGDPVQACLATLPLDQRIALVLSDVQGLSYHDIATVTGGSVDVVRARLSQGRAALRDTLRSRGEIGP